MSIVKTFEGRLYHREHGLVRVCIYRAVASRTGSQSAATQQILAVREPSFEDLWAGDLIEVFDLQGALIERYDSSDPTPEDVWTSTLTDSGNYSTSGTKSTKS
jgi:hypothetical protein